ncbi:hypothetical protein B0H13DRAFT_2681637 [Mycena leptocephala]|nr:hypothetical protein B0H13DRAFT_2681637 [Mycena leptocephala]
MSSLPSKNVSPLWPLSTTDAPNNLSKSSPKTSRLPPSTLDLLRLPLLFLPWHALSISFFLSPILNLSFSGLRPRALQDCVSSSRLQGLLVPNQSPLGPRRRSPLVLEEVPPQSPSVPTALPNDFVLPVLPPPEDLPSAPSMDAYDEEEWYSFSTQSALYSPKDQREQEQREQREREKKSGKPAKAPPSSTVVVVPSAAPAKRNTRSSTATTPAPAKSVRKRTASVVSDGSDANSRLGPSPAKPSAPKKKVKIDLDETKINRSRPHRPRLPKARAPNSFRQLTPDRIKKIAQNLTDVLNRLVKDNKTDLVPTELNQINLFTEADSEYFVVLVKKRPSHVYKFSSHQPETSTNRTSRPDLAALPPLSKPVALIPEETVTQVSFENAITAIDSCLRCNLEHKRCIPLGLGASCANCIKERFRFCDHHLTLQEILDFHARVASDVIEADDKLPIFIASLNDATLRLAAAAQSHADAVKSAEYYFAQLVDLTRRSIRRLGTAAFYRASLRPTTLRPSSNISTRSSRRTTGCLRQTSRTLPERAVRRRLRAHQTPSPSHVYAGRDRFEPKGPTTIDAEADAETDQESAESEEAAAERCPKDSAQEAVSSKTDSGKARTRPRRRSRCRSG